MSRSILKLSALLIPAAFTIACSSTNAGVGGSATTSTTTGGGDAGSGDGGDAGTSCRGTCVANHAAGYQKFTGYILKECGCPAAGPDGGTDAGVVVDAGGPPCESECTAQCADPTTLTSTSPCGTCLAQEGAKGTASTCTDKAALVDCTDTECAAFVACALPCTN